jgi:hypothetical protein
MRFRPWSVFAFAIHPGTRRQVASKELSRHFTLWGARSRIKNYELIPNKNQYLEMKYSALHFRSIAKNLH